MQHRSCTVPSQLDQVAAVLKALVETGDLLPLHPTFVTPFHSSCKPNVAIDWYFTMVAVNSGLQDE